MQKGLFGRKDRLIKEKRHDVYRESGKYPEPGVCTHCGAVFSNGCWSWKTISVEHHEIVCPACRRIEDHLPAGYVKLGGQFFSEHREEILGLVRNIEKQERESHPLERIIQIIEENGSVSVTTTGVHVARRIGEALSRSYKGKYSFHYGDGEKSIQVSWNR